MCTYINHNIYQQQKKNKTEKKKKGRGCKISKHCQGIAVT